MKTHGTAVLTALQARYKTIEEIEELIYHRQLKAIIKDTNAVQWLDCFWQQMAILEAVKINAAETK